jgi:tRNA-dihydrouridine synthase 3
MPSPRRHDLAFTVFLSSHFGSDTTGLNTTRRYLCEALSFQYRYVPIGLLEQLPGRINDRAPAFRGRDELGKDNP